MKSSKEEHLKSASQCVERELLQKLLSCDFASKFRHNITPNSDFLSHKFSLSRSEHRRLFSLSLSLFSCTKTSLLKITLSTREVHDLHRSIFVETVAIYSYENTGRRRSKS